MRPVTLNFTDWLEAIFWHSFWHIFWHSFYISSDIASDIRSRGWGPAGNTGHRRSQVRLRKKLAADDRSWGLAGKTGRGGSRLRSGTVGVRQGTLHAGARGWGLAVHTGDVRLAVEEDKERDEERKEGRKEKINMKSNNPHVTGGEKMVPVWNMSNFEGLHPFDPFWILSADMA